MLKTPANYTLAAWIIIALSALLLSYSTWCGLGLTYDSYDYLAAAESFKEDFSLLNKKGSQYTFHAPLFPVFLSLFEGYSRPLFCIVNIVICLTTLILLFRISSTYFKNKLLFLIGFTSIGLNVGFQMIHNFLWTDPLFLLLFVFHNYFLLRFLERYKKTDFWLLICFAFLMALTRNAGFFIILPTSGILLLYAKGSKFKSSLIYTLFSSIGFVLWNISVASSKSGKEMFEGNEFLSGTDLNFINYADIISQWFLPGFIPSAFRIFFLMALLTLFFFLINKEKLSLHAKTFLIQFVVYLILMIIAIKVNKDEIERLLSVIAPWLFMALFMILDLKWENIKQSSRRWILVLLVLWLSYTGFRGVYNSIGWHEGRCAAKKLSTSVNEFH